MSEVQIPLNPVGRKDIHQLESILLTATLLRPEVVEMIKNSAERVTWVDSLAVAAGAVAREKAGMTLPQIAQEMERSEEAVRNHLKGKSKAGQLVKETYEMLKKAVKEGNINQLFPFTGFSEDSKKLEEEVEKLKKEKEELKQQLTKLKEEVEELIKRLG